MYLSLCARLFLCVNTGYVHVLVGVEVRTTSAVRPHQGLFVVCWCTRQASEGPMSFGEIACLCLLSQYRSTRSSTGEEQPLCSYQQQWLQWYVVITTGTAW